MANIYNMSDVWNDGGTTFTAIKMDVTDTDSASGSLLMDLQVGGSSKFSVDKEGLVSAGIGKNLGINTYLIFEAGLGSGDGFGVSFGAPAIFNGNSTHTIFNNNECRLVNSSGSFSWRNGGTRLFSDANYQLDQRNSTNAQTFNIYNTYTDASNYERARFGWDSNTFEISGDTLGTGTARSFRLENFTIAYLTATSFLEFNWGSSASRSLRMLGDAIYPKQANNSLDLGTDTLRWKNIFVATSVKSPLFDLDSGTIISALPASPTVGMIARVTDGDSGLTFGNTVVNSGAGATPYLVWYNGTNWTVIGA